MNTHLSHDANPGDPHEPEAPNRTPDPGEHRTGVAKAAKNRELDPPA
jgi:hypothetical protein